MTNFFVLVGAPGTGKTTVLSHLRARGYPCFTEAARYVLEENLATQGPALPSNDPLLFVQTMQKKNIEDFDKAKSFNGPVFFDRGMPDLVHYAIRFNVPPAEFEQSSKKYTYNPNVFLFAPWKEIFVNDQVRPLPFEKTAEIHALLSQVYKTLGYNLIEVPTGPADSRADFILKSVEQ